MRIRCARLLLNERRGDRSCQSLGEVLDIFSFLGIFMRASMYWEFLRIIGDIGNIPLILLFKLFGGIGLANMRVVFYINADCICTFLSW